MAWCPEPHRSTAATTSGRLPPWSPLAVATESMASRFNSIRSGMCPTPNSPAWKTPCVPTWITARRLGATAVLYAVFVGGWFLGQPLPHVGCDTPDPSYVAEGPDTIAEPGQVSAVLGRMAHQVATADVVTISTSVLCDGTPTPRLVAWVTGDWR